MIIGQSSRRIFWISFIKVYLFLELLRVFTCPNGRDNIFARIQINIYQVIAYATHKRSSTVVICQRGFLAASMLYHHDNLKLAQVLRWFGMYPRGDDLRRREQSDDEDSTKRMMVMPTMDEWKKRSLLLGFTNSSLPTSNLKMACRQPILLYLFNMMFLASGYILWAIQRLSFIILLRVDSNHSIIATQRRRIMIFVLCHETYNAEDENWGRHG